MDKRGVWNNDVIMCNRNRFVGGTESVLSFGYARLL